MITVIVTSFVNSFSCAMDAQASSRAGGALALGAAAPAAPGDGDVTGAAVPGDVKEDAHAKKIALAQDLYEAIDRMNIFRVWMLLKAWPGSETFTTDIVRACGKRGSLFWHAFHGALVKKTAQETVKDLEPIRDVFMSLFIFEHKEDFEKKIEQFLEDERSVGNFVKLDESSQAFIKSCIVLKLITLYQPLSLLQEHMINFNIPEVQVCIKAFPLHIATYCGNLPLVYFLVTSRIFSINSVNNNNETALFFVRRSQSMTALLLHLNINTKIINCNSEDAYWDVPKEFRKIVNPEEHFHSGGCVIV